MDSRQARVNQIEFRSLQHLPLRRQLQQRVFRSLEDLQPQIDMLQRMRAVRRQENDPFRSSDPLLVERVDGNRIDHVPAERLPAAHLGRCHNFRRLDQDTDNVRLFGQHSARGDREGILSGCLFLMHVNEP